MSQARLLTSLRFWPIFWTQALGALNDNLFKGALLLFIKFRDQHVFGIDPDTVVAMGAGIFILPFFLFSASAGYVSDKFEKSRLVQAVKLWEVLLMAFACYGFTTESGELLVILLFFMGLQSTFFGPVKYSILPQLVKKEELVGANALVEAGTFAAILCGMIIGGIAIADKESGATIVGWLVIGFALVGLLTSLAVPKVKSFDSSLKVPINPLPPTLKIIRETMANRSVFLSILGISWFWFLGAFFMTLFPSYAKDVLMGDEHVATFMFAMFTVGICFGSLVCEKLSRRVLELGLVPFGSIGLTLFALDLYLVGEPEVLGTLRGIGDFISGPGGIRISIDLLLYSFFGGMYIVPLYTMMQLRSSDHDRSRVIAANNVINALFMVGSAALLAIFFQLKLAIPTIFLIIALMNIAVAAYVYTLLPEFVYRFVCWLIVNIMYRMQVVNRERIPSEGAAILTCNHVSFIDWMVVASACDRPVRIIMDHTFMKNSLVKFLYKEAKVIPIAPRRENEDLLEAAFLRIAEELKDEQVVVIFPEGMITGDGQMNTFKSGIEKILQESPVPVIPMALSGLWGSFFSRHNLGRALSKPFHRFWSSIRLSVGEPIEARDVTASKLQSVTLELRGDVL